MSERERDGQYTQFHTTLHFSQLRASPGNAQAHLNLKAPTTPQPVPRPNPPRWGNTSFLSKCLPEAIFQTVSNFPFHKIVK